ncbi:MAG TPA: phosphoribosylaminoimidazolesuccinocarboxamide synthase [Candidatus Nanoarchaeia archaeon]|nr:phosphoribosylaminoimidazolesuccinocarboxamide synthase [Candidatus Nanoarchaeia archaeon]
MENLNEQQARKLVEECITDERAISSTQAILDSGAIPRLQGYAVRPGKVSDSIYGGMAGGRENPPLLAKDGRPLRIMVRTERISTHDITRGSIPFKDQILAANHNYMRRLVEQDIGTSQLEVPGLEDTAVAIAAENLHTIPVENIFRAYAAKSTTSTSLYQAYFVRGERIFAGHALPEGLIPNGPLPYIMDTPSTKSDEHDETLDPEEMIRRGICTREQYHALRQGGLAAFDRAARYLAEKGIILVDTKFEHGVDREGHIVSQDEILTMDSSRFWLSDDYQEQTAKLRRGEIAELSPKSYSKEFARGFSEGDKGYTPEQRVHIAVRYIMGIQRLLGKPFVPDRRPRDERVVTGLQRIVDELVA